MIIVNVKMDLKMLPPGILKFKSYKKIKSKYITVIRYVSNAVYLT
jgi:hypothetical protein